MASVVHILNGDALDSYFPDSVKGQRIIFREVLMDGPLSGRLDKVFYEARAKYLKAQMETEQSYETMVVSQLELLKTIDAGTKVYLWFEYDLFCQVNYWQCIAWLEHYNKGLELYWVRPSDIDSKGFASYTTAQLSELYCTAKRLDKMAITTAARILASYKQRDRQKLADFLLEEKLDDNTQLILQAQLDRLPDKTSAIALLNTVRALKNEAFGDFGQAFGLFCSRYGHYGLGDLQFKLLFDQVEML